MSRRRTTLAFGGSSRRRPRRVIGRPRPFIARPREVIPERGAFIRRPRQVLPGREAVIPRRGVVIPLSETVIRRPRPMILATGSIGRGTPRSEPRRRTTLPAPQVTPRGTRRTASSTQSTVSGRLWLARCRASQEAGRGMTPRGRARDERGSRQDHPAPRMTCPGRGVTSSDRGMTVSGRRMTESRPLLVEIGRLRKGPEQPRKH
jgi:hypothetical protein